MDGGDRLVAEAALGLVDDALEGEVVGGLGDQAEVGEGVADLGALVEAEAADDLVGQADGDEALFELAGLELGADEDGDVVELSRRGAACASISSPTRRASSGPSQTPMTWTFSPSPASVHSVLPRRPALWAMRPVGGGEDVRGRAVILLEPDDLRAGEVLFEAQDVGDLGAAPRIDRLVVVADAAEVAARLGEQLQPLVLRLVGVLIFVDEDVAEAVAIALEHVGVRAEDDQHVEQQVAEVAGVEGAAAAPDRRRRARAPRPLAKASDSPASTCAGVQPRFFQRSIRPASWRAGQRFSSRLAAPISCLSTRSWSSVSRMVKLDCRPTSSAWLRSIRAATEWKVPSHGMPSIAPPRDRRDALLHLARGLVGEGDGEDLARPGLAGGDEVGEAGGQRGGLAGAGAGEDQHRALRSSARPRAAAG